MDPAEHRAAMYLAAAFNETAREAGELLMAIHLGGGMFSVMMPGQAQSVWDEAKVRERMRAMIRPQTD